MSSVGGACGCLSLIWLIDLRASFTLAWFTRAACEYARRRKVDEDPCEGYDRFMNSILFAIGEEPVGDYWNPKLCIYESRGPNNNDYCADLAVPRQPLDGSGIKDEQLADGRV